MSEFDKLLEAVRDAANGNIEIVTEQGLTHHPRLEAHQFVQDLFDAGWEILQRKCPTCGGSGETGGKTGFHYDYPVLCTDCGGTGRIKWVEKDPAVETVAEILGLPEIPANPDGTTDWPAFARQMLDMKKSDDG